MKVWDRWREIFKGEMNNLVIWEIGVLSFIENLVVEE